MERNANMLVCGIEVSVRVWVCAWNHDLRFSCYSTDVAAVSDGH